MFPQIINDIAARAYTAYHSMLQMFMPASMVLYTQIPYYGIPPNLAEDPNISVLPKRSGRLLRRLRGIFRNR